MLTIESELVDLSAVELNPFDYLHRDHADDFFDIADRMLASREILFATPVYWYAMSGRMKTLFDRFTDLLSGRDSAGRGRRLAGCGMWMLAAGTDPDLPPGFEEPFIRSAAYLDIGWRGGCYIPRAIPKPPRGGSPPSRGGSMPRRKRARRPRKAAPPRPAGRGTFRSWRRPRCPRSPSTGHWRAWSPPKPRRPPRSAPRDEAAGAARESASSSW